MSKKKQRTQGQVDTGRRVINDNVYAAMVTSKLFTAKVRNLKKVKVHINVRQNMQDGESYLIAA